jgi:hypothetical protein
MAYSARVMPVLTKHQVPACELLVPNLGGDSALYLHTAGASFELDSDGVCQDVFTLDGSEPGDVAHCLGAQFVGSLSLEGGALLPNPAVGSRALLVDRVEGCPPALIQTAAITGIVYRDDVIDA